jgi:hypothetical protein
MGENIWHVGKVQKAGDGLVLCVPQLNKETQDQLLLAEAKLWGP